MKKIILIFIMVFLGVADVLAIDPQIEGNSSDKKDIKVVEKKDNSSGINLASNAKSAIILENSTGKIIFESNKDEKLPMASMTNIMTT